METTDKFKVLGKTKVIKSSILNPHNAGLRFVLSINNLAGAPEGNPLLPLFDKKWKKVREESRGWFATKTGAYKLGAINTTAVQSDTWVIHMLCQDNDLNFSESGMKDCLKAVAKLAKYEKATVHVSHNLTSNLPIVFTGLLESELLSQGISVFFYEEPV
jgi:hypothetical protein